MKLCDNAGGDDDVVAVQRDMNTFDLLYSFDLHHRHTVDEVLCLDQHTFA